MHLTIFNYLTNTICKIKYISRYLEDLKNQGFESRHGNIIFDEIINRKNYKFNLENPGI